MRNINADTITLAVLATLEHCDHPRLRAIVRSLVQHLHSFARDVTLTESEWLMAIRFLNQIGQVTAEARQELVLLSDVLGLSALVTTQNQGTSAGFTESTVLAPSYGDNVQEYPLGSDISNGARGEPLFVNGRVTALDGTPLKGVSIDISQSGELTHDGVRRWPTAPAWGCSDVRSRLKTDEEGRYLFWSVLAQPSQVPQDGPIGAMLEALGRPAWRPAYLCYALSAPGYRQLTTRVFRDDDPYLDSDAVFGVREALVARWERHDAGTAPDGREMHQPFHTLQFDFVLCPERAAV
jgi:hydroxyquinol 1,2-dioxygenase